MPEIEANGQTIYYEEHGEGEPLICVPGLTQSSLSFIPQIQSFSSRHRLVLLDNRDVGRSSMADDEYLLEDMAQDALALADGLGLDTFHLLGVSMGGAISQQIALAAPERIRTLTLAVTWARGGGWAVRLAETWSARRMKQTLEEHIDELLLLNFSEEFFENAEGIAAVRGMILADPHPQPPEAFGRQLRASSKHHTIDRLPSLSMPVHVIGGEHDILVPVWKSQEIASLIPGAKLTVLPCRAPRTA
jgi:pimeloyl-ACP methyl ester carboxylesterase